MAAGALAVSAGLGGDQSADQSADQRVAGKLLEIEALVAARGRGRGCPTGD